MPRVLPFDSHDPSPSKRSADRLVSRTVTPRMAVLLDKLQIIERNWDDPGITLIEKIATQLARGWPRPND